MNISNMFITGSTTLHAGNRYHSLPINECMYRLETVLYTNDLHPTQKKNAPERGGTVRRPFRLLIYAYMSQLDYNIITQLPSPTSNCTY